MKHSRPQLCILCHAIIASNQTEEKYFSHGEKAKGSAKTFGDAFFLASCILIQECCFLCKIILVLHNHGIVHGKHCRSDGHAQAEPSLFVLLLFGSRTEPEVTGWQGRRLQGGAAGSVWQVKLLLVWNCRALSFLTPRPAAAHLQ